MKRVKRAVILAAGRGSRMGALTAETPKPLLKVLGKPIVETSLDACVAAGIEEIYLVRGYHGEKFDVLRAKYPTLHFIDNLAWESANNIASILAAGELIAGAYVIEGDLYLQNPVLLDPFPQASNYLAIPVQETDDWCFYTDIQGVIKRMDIGGHNCLQMVGFSYWTEADGKKILDRAQKLYRMPSGKKLYWDEIALGAYIEDFTVYARTCSTEDITELDTVEELRAFENRLRMKEQR